MNTCRLCLQEKKLIKAHIIPQFMYKGMKSAENAFYEIKYNLDSKEKKEKKVQTGIFDKSILCGDCDNKIIGGIYESYAEKSIYGNSIDPKCRQFQDSRYQIKYSICENIHYSKLKLFLLSILWRASITNQPAFKNVSLGAKHEEILRNYILNNIAPPEHEYPLMILSYIYNDNDFNNLIIQPYRIKSSDGMNGYIFLMNSLEFIFYVNSNLHSVPNYIKEFTLKEKGIMSVLHLPNGSDKNFIKNVMKV